MVQQGLIEKDVNHDGKVSYDESEKRDIEN